jgi:hypothetical protein
LDVIGAHNTCQGQFPCSSDVLGDRDIGFQIPDDSGVGALAAASVVGLLAAVDADDNLVHCQGDMPTVVITQRHRQVRAKD